MIMTIKPTDSLQCLPVGWIATYILYDHLSDKSAVDKFADSFLRTEGDCSSSLEISWMDKRPLNKDNRTLELNSVWYMNMSKVVAGIQ